MADLRQSPQYANYLRLLGWKIEKVDNCYVFIHQFPLVGSFIKIQRPEKLPPIEKIFAVVKKYRALRVSIEPLQLDSKSARQQVSKCGFKPSSPSLPSKTLFIDLTKSKDKIFAGFTSAKRRAIRRAVKNKVVVQESEDIEGFIKLKNKQHGLSGRVLKVDKQFRALWQAFQPKKAALLLACSSPGHPDPPTGGEGSLAGVLLLFHNQITHYYQAASNKSGNKLAAPSLLVWEALKLSKEKGCKTFDFEGIYDSRFPQKSWLGFTRFKKGFGGKEVVYPVPLVRSFMSKPHRSF